MGGNSDEKENDYSELLICTPLTCYGLFTLVYSIILYNSINTDDTTTGYISIFACSIFVAIILTAIYWAVKLSAILIIGGLRNSSKEFLQTAYIVVYIIYIILGLALFCTLIVNIVYTILIVHEFLAYNCAMSYDYFWPMLFFVMLLIIPWILPIASIIVLTAVALALLAISPILCFIILVNKYA